MKTTPLRGVNLGGWLVLEKWITPSLFVGTDANDEHSFCQQAGAPQRRKLQQFRDQFITKQDFEWLALHGIETVRLPVGYWLFGGEDAEPYVATVEYVDKAFTWAKQTGLRILLDLHGAPNSQNGKDHSGQIGTAGWGSDTNSILRTLDVIRRIAERYGNHPALLGISLLNEPAASISKSILLDYYDQAYSIIRELCGEDIWIIYSDGYAPRRWRKALTDSRYKNICIDRHQYQVFSPLDSRLPVWLSLLRTRFIVPCMLARFSRHHPVIIGEWSLVLGSTELGKRPVLDRHRIARAYGQLQLQAYRATAAWFYWTYRTEGGGAWSFRDSIEKGLLDYKK